MTSSLIEAVAEVQRAQRAVERVQRERDAAAYVSFLRRGDVPRQNVKSPAVTTSLRRPNGSPLPAADALNAIRDALAALSASADSES
jgi:hypothetical protein